MARDACLSQYENDRRLVRDPQLYLKWTPIYPHPLPTSYQVRGMASSMCLDTGMRSSSTHQEQKENQCVVVSHRFVVRHPRISETELCNYQCAAVEYDFSGIATWWLYKY